MNRSGFTPKPCLKFCNLTELAGFTGLPAGFFICENWRCHGLGNPAPEDLTPSLVAPMPLGLLPLARPPSGFSRRQPAPLGPYLIWDRFEANSV
jgi:hypothetical protein